MKDVGSNIAVKNIPELVLKEIYGICETKKHTREETKNYKMTEREIYEKYDNLSRDELNTKSNENVYGKNSVMTSIIKHCKTEKKEE